MGALATIGIGGTVTAQESEMIGAAEVGLNEDIRELLLQGKNEEAKSLAEKHDIRFTISESGGDGVETMTRNSKSSSTLYCSLMHKEDDVWTATGQARLRGQVPRVRSSHRVDDVCGLTWDNDNWTPISQSESNTWSEVDNGAVEMDYQSPYEHTGVVFKIDEFLVGHEFTAVLSTDLIRENNDPRHGVQFNYEHTYSYWSGIVNVDAVLPNQIKAILPTGTKSWKDDAWAAVGD